MLKAELLAIGDELLIGQVLNTNAQWIAQELNQLGIVVSYMTTVSDSKEAIINALDKGLEHCDFIFITGGLGPTKDDITKHTLTEYFKGELTLNKDRLEKLRLYFEKRGRVMNTLNESQAMLPNNCFNIENEVGTACGMWFETSKNKSIISMPGVPYEMKDMMQKIILPKIKLKYFQNAIEHRTFRTFGIGESELASIIEDWETNLPSFLKLAYLPNVGQVRLRISGTHKDQDILSKTIKQQGNLLYSLIGEYIFGEGEEELEDVVGVLLTNKKINLSTAESCTGGYLAHKLTSVSGSSNYFIGSTIAYSNQVKVNELNVKEATISEYGAVSKETVSEMAENTRVKYNTDLALSTSGIAGPTGGSDEKPTGTIWIALATKEITITKKLQLGGDRKRNIHLASLHCLFLLYNYLIKDKTT